MPNRRVMVALLAVLAVVPAAAGGAPVRDSVSDSFVTRSGTQLRAGGLSFRFGGANVEWLGVSGYGPADPAGPQLPSHYEIDDAMATARELGASVVRSQTMADSVGCAVCIEPTLGTFNAAAFERVDYALASARRHGLKIVATFVGDDARAGGTGCVYLGWRGIDVPGCSLIEMAPFWTDETVIGDLEAHIAAILDHVNVYTHVAYKDDPTILGWDLLNGGGSPTPWTRQISQFVRGIDSRHLILSGYANAGLDQVDACVGFIYPHWFQPLDVVKPWIATCKRAGKPFLAYEYGWDRTNYRTLAGLRGFLEALRRNPTVAGDAFWALQAHADGHGWMPIPADSSDPTVATELESGQWWAMYYPGIQTLVSTTADMTARAQVIRAHNYAMRAIRLPAHAVPPPPTVTSVDYGPTSFVGRVGARVYWQGSAGAIDYTVQRSRAQSGPWATVCTRCATDLDDGYVDLGNAASRAWYRVIPYNLDGRRGPASQAMQAHAG